MASEEFDTRLYPGEVTGLRAFKVTKEGKLTSPMRQECKITPGENVARCDLRSPFGLYWDPGRGWVMEWSRDHQVAGRHCMCGFYGYWDGSNDYVRRPSPLSPNISAVVKAYGHVTIGTRGFRAEKMKVVGVVLSSTGRSVRWSRYWLVLCAVETVILIANLFRTDWSGVFVAAAFVALWLGFAAGWSWNPLPWFRRQKFKRNYPGVKVYRSEMAMVKAHPLTNPYDFVERK